MSSEQLAKAFRGSRANFGSFFDYTAKAIDKYGPIQTYLAAFSNPIGMEIELEGYDVHHDQAWAQLDPLFWRQVEDGSLRNHGRELVSIPVAGKCIDYAIHEYEQWVKKNPVSWSVRTSIHVHCNVNTFTFDQLYYLTTLYAIYENLFFSLAHPNRKGNPFCFPLTSTSPDVAHHITANNKYCAYNTGPIERQLTVEFRHMHGTDDCRLIRRWAQLICKLYRHAERTYNPKWRQDLLKVFENASYFELAKRMFGASIILFEGMDFVTQCSEPAEWATCFMTVKDNG